MAISEPAVLPGKPATDTTGHPTHMAVDGAVHTIARIDEHDDGPAHTHRVHLGCGMTVDVDIGGARAHARSMERLGHVANEKDEALKAIHVPLHTKAAKLALEQGETWKHERWHHADSSPKAKGCEACELHDAGAPPVALPLGHTPARTRPADVETNIACPKCGARVYRRNGAPSGAAGEFACTGQGHEYSAVELMDYLKKSFESLTALTK